MRPSWDSYFFAQADLVSTRSTCSRASVGCVIVRDRRILATGYNGALARERHCAHTAIIGHDSDAEFFNGQTDTDDLGHCSISVHAEMNAVADCARRGVSCDGATAYVNKEPCYNCVKLLKSAGILDIRSK